MNILILSCGTRNKIIQYVKKACHETGGKCIATDCASLVSAIFEADKYYIVPRITADHYIDAILNICIKENIQGAFSLIDPELSLIAKNEEKFSEIGVKIIGSNYEICERSLNKYKMYQWLSEHGYACAKSYIDKTDFYKALSNHELDYPVFVKPINGSASVAVSKVTSQEEIELFFNKHQNLMIQEYLKGQEIGADVYIDMLHKKVVSIFTKKKIAMRAGETDRAVSFKDKQLFELIERFVIECGYLGQIDIDVFDINGKYFISEVNPRFGGGYPHAYACGCDHIKALINNIAGIPNEVNIGNYEEGIYMFKYNDIVIRNKQEVVSIQC